MIKWNEVTWYSRLGALILFLAVFPILTFYIGTQYQATLDSDSFFLTKTQQNLIPQTHQSVTNSASLTVHDYKVVNGTSKKYPSPDGKYIAVSASDEQGNSATSITDSSGKALTPSYCGFYSAWTSDGTKVKVLLPPECGYGGNQNKYYYLDLSGAREAVEGSTFVPNAQ